MPPIQTSHGRTIHYSRTGDGPPLLLVMGGGESQKQWEPQVAELSSHFTVITFDNRDVGESTPEAEPYTLADLTADTVALLDALRIERAHLAGQSMGAAVCINIAVDHPSRVNKLVLLGAVPHPVSIPAMPREQWVADHADLIRAMFPMLVAPGYFDEHAEVLEQAASRGRETSLTYDGFMRHLTIIAQIDLRDRLPDISVPTLMIYGDQDPFVPQQLQHEYARTVPNAQFVVLPGVGHLAFVERDAEVNRLMKAFLLGEPLYPA